MSLFQSSQSGRQSISRRELLRIGGTCTFLMGIRSALRLESSAEAANFTKGYCTYWAEKRFNEILGGRDRLDWSGNAGLWVKNAEKNGWMTVTQPLAGEAGSIIVWEDGAFGHVGFVESIKQWPLRYVISEMNYGKWTNQAQAITDKFNQTTNVELATNNLHRTVKLRFAGFVLPRRKAPPPKPGVAPKSGAGSTVLKK